MQKCYIPKQSVINILYDVDISQKIRDLITAKIADLEPADVKEVKRAKWVKYPCVWECSECRHWEDRQYNDNPPPFCSRCGAEMG